MLKTYNKTTRQRVISIDGVKLSPGVDVYFLHFPKSRGIIVGITKDEITVLWSIFPNNNDVVFPSFRQNVGYISSSSIISIQPMTGPSAAVFYHEYKYNQEPSGSK